MQANQPLPISTTGVGGEERLRFGLAAGAGWIESNTRSIAD
jgi:hypothetical protein